MLIEELNSHFAKPVLYAGADFGGLISLYNEDCLQALKRYDDNAFDVAIVDPPYGIGISSNTFRASVISCEVALWSFREVLLFPLVASP